MLFDDQETQRLIGIIRDGARAWTLAEMEQVDRAMRLNKPPGYDQHIEGLRARYLGDAKRFVVEKQRARFKKTHDAMPTESLPYLRFLAASDAGVYRLPPERTPTDPTTGEPLTDEVRLRAFNALLEGADLDGKAPEIERRAIAAKTLFVLPRWFRPPSENAGGRLILEQFWSDDVGVLCHRSDPGNFDLCLVLKAKIASRTGVASATQWFSLWVREFEEDEAGELMKLGPWRVHLVNSRGEYAIPPNDDRTLYVDNAGNPLPLPWVLIRLGDAAGCIYVDEDRDLMDVVDGLNVSRNSRKLTVDMQGHTPVVYAGNQKKPGTVVWGPGEVTEIGDKETMTTLALDPKIEEMQHEAELDLNELGRVRRNPAGYATRDGQVASGVARQIENEPHEALLDENAHTFRLIEQNALLPAMVRVHDAFSGNPPIGPCGFRVMTRKPPPPEEPEAKLRRLQAEVDAGILTPAQMAVELGRYPNVDAAKKAGISGDLKTKPSSSTTLPPRFDQVANDQAQQNTNGGGGGQ